ncbi:sorting nexin-4-like [Argonauta hians]
MADVPDSGSSENLTESASPSTDSENEDSSPPPPPPKKTHLLQWMEITVSEPEKRTIPSMKMQDTYIVYLVETRVTDPEMKGFGDAATSVWRRYSEFEIIRNYLEAMYPQVVVPPLPEKKATFLWQNAPSDKFNLDFIERRRAALEIFLLRCSSHPTLCADKIFVSFLRQENGWKELACASEFQSKAESKIKSLSAAFRLKRPDRQFEELKNYSNELQSIISTILKIRAKLADRLYGIHKIHANYARVYAEWSSLEKEMSEGLKGSGHYMDVFANSVDAILEEEEQYADQLKEYLAFADSLRNVCRKYECIQYDLEKTEECLSTKGSQKDMLNQGKQQGGFTLSNVKTKLFGGDTPEQRDQKVKVLEQQIHDSEAELKVVTEDTQVFMEQALKDIDRFERQKVKDLKEIFTNYAIMQIKQSKKGIAIWTSAKDCYSKM